MSFPAETPVGPDGPERPVGPDRPNGQAAVGRRVAGEQGPPPLGSVAWRRVHRATPLIRSWQAIVAVTLIGVFTILDTGAAAEGLPQLPILAAIVGGVLLIVVIVSLGYAYLAWRRIAYAIGEDAVFYHHGILFRVQRHARLNRIQGVDITRPLLGRLVGLASLTIESAGSGDARVVIEYLLDEEAERLRAEILARAAGLIALAPEAQYPPGVPGAYTGVGGAAAGQEAVAGVGTGAATAAASIPAAAGIPTATATAAAGIPASTPVFARAPEQIVNVLPTGTLVRSLLYSGITLTFLLATLAWIALLVTVHEAWLVMIGLPILITFFAVLWSRFVGHFGHTVALSPDGIRLRHGLLSTQAQTIPPGRIQAFRISQPLFWRPKDWWRVEVNVAGYAAPTQGDSSLNVARNVLLPVAPRDLARYAAWIMHQGLAPDEASLEAGLTGTRQDGGFLHSPRAACWLDPIAWKRNGLLITPAGMLMRSGRLTRRLTFVPHERTQSLAISQGPIQRALHLATLHAHSVPGPITPLVRHLPALTARDMLMEQAVRAREARSREGPAEWMRRVAATGPIMEP